MESRAALEAVVRHAVDLEDDYEDIAPVVTALTGCGDVALVPRLHEALNQFLDQENFYGRDLIAGILPGIQGGGSPCGAAARLGPRSRGRSGQPAG